MAYRNYNTYVIGSQSVALEALGRLQPHWMTTLKYLCAHALERTTLERITSYSSPTSCFRSTELVRARHPASEPIIHRRRFSAESFSYKAESETPARVCCLLIRS